MEDQITFYSPNPGTIFNYRHEIKTVWLYTRIFGDWFGRLIIQVSDQIEYSNLSTRLIV